MTAKQSLPERLRETAGLYHASLEDVSMHMDAILKAADEIERLERELKEANDKIVGLIRVMHRRVAVETAAAPFAYISTLETLLREMHDYQADSWNPTYWRPRIMAALMGCLAEPTKSDFEWARNEIRASEKTQALNTNVDSAQYGPDAKTEAVRISTQPGWTGDPEKDTAHINAGTKEPTSGRSE